MKLETYSTQRPTLSTTQAGVDLSITGQVESYVQLENGSFVYTFTMGLVSKPDNVNSIKSH